MKSKIIFGLLNLTAGLPLGILYIFSDLISFVLYHVIRYRRDVVITNLTSAFPDKSQKEIKNIEKSFYRFLGDQVVETIKLLHISDSELMKRVKVVNYEAVNNDLTEGKNIVILMGHYGNWEWVQEISRYFISSAFLSSIYHPLKNKVWDEFLIQLRRRWGAHIIPMKKATRTLLNKDNFPWVCGFIADARPDAKNEDHTLEFLHHKTYFITGPEIIGHKVGAEFFYLHMLRKRRGHYDIIFSRINPSDQDISFPYLRQFWREFEKTIEKAPAYWLWSHKRWK